MKISEVDLAKPVIEWLLAQHWEVYQEVQLHYGGSIADVVALKNNIMWVVECKTSFTLTVLEQALHWNSHYRSIAVPSAKNEKGRTFANMVASDYGIGVFELTEYGGEWHVNDRIPPKLQRQNTYFVKNYYLPRMTEEQKTWAEAGNNHGDRYTPYQSTMKEVKWFIKNHPGCTIGEIYKELGKCHYSSDQSAKGSISNALRTFEKDWCDAVLDGKIFRFYLREEK